MQRTITVTAFAFVVSGATIAVSPYPAMAPLGRYLMPVNAEIALARSAAPKSVSDDAEVMVLGRHGYRIAVKGTNGFMCIVGRGWSKPIDDPDFWNPRIRSPICYNAPATKTFVPAYLMRTKLILAGDSKAQMLLAVTAALDGGELPALASGTIAYMMSKQQYLADRGKHWHPHLMWMAPGDVAESWGANLAHSPVIATYDPEQRVTTFMVIVAKWSDETPGPPITIADTTRPTAEGALTTDERITRALQASDVTALRRLLASDWIVISAEGGYTGRADVLQAIKSGIWTHTLAVVSSPRVRVYDGTTALVTEHAMVSGMFANKPYTNLQECQTDVLIWKDGGWVSELLHESFSTRAKTNC